jgi:hypothetical protein
MNVMELEKKLKQSKGLQARFHPTWYLNSAFFMGQQWLFWNRSRLDRPRLEPWRQMVTDNRILGFVRSEVAKMTKAKPAFTIVPVTADDADLQASLTGQKVLNFLWRDLNMRNKLMDTLYWSRICGAGFWKIYWDAALGEKITVVCDEEGQIVCHPDSLGEDENGQPIPNPVGGAPKTLSDFPEGLPEGHKPKVLATGDVAIETVSPFEFFPDPIAKELEDAEWCIQVNVKSKEYVLQHFGIEMEGDTEVASGPAESQLFPSYQMGGASGYRGIKLHEYWLKPNAKHPNGLRVVWAKGKVLCEEPNPYKCLPYVMFKGVVVPGRFWPTSIVEQLRGPQMELNKAKSQILENAVRMGNPALLAAKQANVQYSGKPGERIDFDDTVPNAIPSYLQAPPMPQYVLQQQDRIETSMQEIAGQHEVSSAQVPAGVTAASAINLLMEADDTRLGPSIYDMEEMLGKAAEKLLELVAKYWTTERTILISGEDQEWDVFNFRGAALKENTHVECQAGSAFPQSKAAKQAAIQNILSLALQYGQQPMNPRNLRKVLRDYDAGGLEVLFGDLGVDEAQINRENGQLSRGAELHINAFDDQQGHIEGHTEFQKGPVYQQLPEPIQKNVERHVVEHREQLMKAMPPPLAEEQRAPQAGPGGPEAQASAPAPAAPEAPAKPPSETLNYKDAPPDVKRQIEQQAGLEPSKEEAHIAAQAALQAAPQPAAQPERQ